MLISKPPEIKNFSTSNRRGKNLPIDRLLDNRISIGTLKKLRNDVTEEDLSNILQRIYDLNEKYILQLSAVEGILRRLNDIKNTRRNKKFLAKIKAGFRSVDDPDKKNHKIILAE